MNECNGTDNHDTENGEKQAFVLRISLRGFGVEKALDANQIAIGWSTAQGLLDENLSWKRFRQIISDEYYPDEANMRKAGGASGHLWRFIRDMNDGDLVVVPHVSDFYVAEVVGRPTYDESKIDEDAAYRRNVRWLNNKNSIPRSLARAALISRMNIHGTSAYASDLLPQIEECLNIAKYGSEPEFWRDLQMKLIKNTLQEMREGRIEDYGFEHLVREVLINLGAKDADIVPRNKDEGADIVATFNVAEVISQTVAIQVKHWQPEPPVGKGVVDKLKKGINAESADLGMIVTTGTFSEDARVCADEFFNESGIKIELVDGELLAKLIVEYGIKSN